MLVISNLNYIIATLETPGWYANLVTFIEDILKENGHAMPILEIYENYSVTLTNYYYMSLKDAISSEWGEKSKFAI